MTNEILLKRKYAAIEESSLAGPSYRPSRDAEGVHMPTHPGSGVESRFGTHTAPQQRDDFLAQSFTDSIVHDQGRAHFGNNHNNYYYNTVASSTTTAREEDTYEKYLEALGFDRMDYRQAAIDPAYSVTCQWIFEDERYQRWRDPAFRDSNRGLLWIKGKPGTGKSTLMKRLFEHLRYEQLGLTVIPFFFNARGAQLERSVQGCYRSLLYRLLEQVPRLRSLIDFRDIPREGTEWTDEVLRDKLRKVVRAMRQERLILMIDALDECVKLQDVRNMVNFLDGLAEETRLNAISFNICFASRHYPQITMRACESLILESEDLHTRDIRDFVNSNVLIEPAMQKRMVRTLVRKSRGVFMWAVLVTRRLNHQYDLGIAMNKRIAGVEDLPVELNALIGRITAEGTSDPHFLPAMLWTLVSFEKHLNLEGFCFAIQFSAGQLPSPHRNESMVDLDDLDAVRRFVLHSSKGLVEIIDHQKRNLRWQFIHETVRQHVLDGGLRTIRSTLELEVEATSHAIIAEWCREYLGHDALPSAFTSHPIENYVLEVGQMKMQVQAWRDFPLLFYAQHFSADHAELGCNLGCKSSPSPCSTDSDSWYTSSDGDDWAASEY